MSSWFSLVLAPLAAVNASRHEALQQAMEVDLFAGQGEPPPLCPALVIEDLGMPHFEST